MDIISASLSLLRCQELHNQTRRSKRILLVDDEPDICMVYQIVLQDAGFECIPYTDSVNAQQDFRPNYYDLILLDIIMPMLDGLEFCKKIRELDKNGSVNLTGLLVLGM